jgi:hypothetical protein
MDSKEFRQDHLWNATSGYGETSLKLIRERIVGHRRWTVEYEYILQEVETGEYYRWVESKGATEMQDDGTGWEMPGDMVECKRVWPVQVTLTDYISAD